MEKYVKTYIDVIVKMRTDGSMLPLCLIWDGREYGIDKVKDIRIATADHVGGLAMRYVCLVEGREKLLFLEEKPLRWFVEKYIVSF